MYWLEFAQRTHSLSNPEKLFGIYPGNSSEWTAHNDANGKASPGVDWMELKDGEIDGSSQPKSEFVPRASVTRIGNHLVNGKSGYLMPV